MFAHAHTEAWKKVSLRLLADAAASEPKALDHADFDLYDEPLPLTNAKACDLHKMCQWLPAAFHSLYPNPENSMDVVQGYDAGTDYDDDED